MKSKKSKKERNELNQLNTHRYKFPVQFENSLITHTHTQTHTLHSSILYLSNN